MCLTLPKITCLLVCTILTNTTIYYHYAMATQCHVYVIGVFHLHTCKLIKFMSLCVVDLLITSSRLTVIQYKCKKTVSGHLPSIHAQNLRFVSSAVPDILGIPKFEK